MILSLNSANDFNSEKRLNGALSRSVVDISHKQTNKKKVTRTVKPGFSPVR